MKIFWLALCLFFTIPALADETVKDQSAFCKMLERLTSKNADYVAGVDVHGKPVMPADLDSDPNNINNPILVPIQMDLAQRYGLTDLPSSAELKPTIVNLEIHQDGRILYNDQDISKKVVTSCEQVKTDGQKPANAVVSGDKIINQNSK